MFALDRESGILQFGKYWTHLFMFLSNFFKTNDTINKNYLPIIRLLRINTGFAEFFK